MNKSSFKLLIFMIVALSLNIFAQKPKTSNTPKVVATSQVNSSAKIEQMVLDEINLLRLNPQSYVKILEEMKSGIKDKIANLPNGTRWQMNEGVTALDDAINDLKKTAKLPAFAFSNGLSKVAYIQLNNLQEDMSLGHFGKDGSDLENRLNKIGIFGEKYSENIAYYSKDARSIVLTLVIDDGLKSRSHRKNLLSTQLKQIGIGYGIGKKDVGLCVIVFADNFTEKAK